MLISHYRKHFRELYYESKSMTYISVDIESSGPIPGEYSMLSLGACVVGYEENTNYTFYRELQPISNNYITEALEVTGFSLEDLKVNGIAPKECMKNFMGWMKEVSKKKPVFVAHPIAFDWSFVNYYFHKFMGCNPFGVSGIDLKSVWIGKTNSKWYSTSINDIKRTLNLTHISHTHNALNDAKEQSIIFRKMLEFIK